MRDVGACQGLMGYVKQQRDSEGDVVGKVPVGMFAVGGQAFAVIGGHDHQRGRCFRVGQAGEQAADLLIDECDFPIVEVV
jgi:hypothetical protein